MKSFFSVLAVALLMGVSPAAAQLRVDGMLTTDSKFDNFAISAVPSPIASLTLGKQLSVDGVVLPSLLMDKDLKNFQPALGVGLVVHVDKFDLAYATFKREEGWVNHYGVVVKF